MIQVQESQLSQINNRIRNNYLSTDKQQIVETVQLESQRIKHETNNQQLRQTQALKLPQLDFDKKKIMNTTFVQKFKPKQIQVKEFGLSEEEKQIYGDRFPAAYVKLDILGKGGFALVWLVLDKKIGQKFALKQIAKINGCSIFDREKRFFQHFFKNKDKIALQGYQNLIEIQNFEQSNKDIWITQELGGKTLSKVMYNLKGEFYKGERVYSITETDFTLQFYKNPSIFIQILKGIAQGIEFIYSQGFTHCDLKPENILIQYDSSFQIEQIKLIDYGSSFTLQDIENIGMVTPEYMAPEVLDIIHNWNKYQNHYRSQIDLLRNICDVSNVDIWSYGAVILDILCGIPHWLSYKGKIIRGGKNIVKIGLFSSKGRELDKIMIKQIQVIGQLEQIVNENALFLNKTKKLELINLLQSILTINPQERANPQIILKHQFFQ